MRIVSLVPSHTETLHDLGLADRVVGRTRFCIHPKPWVDGLAIIGGTKDARPDKILALRPDLVVADKDENPLALVQTLQKAGVDVIWSDIATVEDAADFVLRLGARCGVEPAGRRESDAIRAALEAARANRPSKPIPVFCPIWHDPWMTFDASAFPNAMIDAVGFQNVFAKHEGPRYFEVTAKEVFSSQAEHALLPTEPFPFHKRLKAIDTVPLGRCGSAGRVHVVDGEALTWFGSRTARGIPILAELAHDLASKMGR
jgi:ABC-type hemin transport system substrate-binding protein